MTIRDVLLTIRQRWWVLLTCIVLGTGVGIGIAAAGPATYSSLSTVVVAIPGIDQGSMQPPGGINVLQRATNYAGIANGSRVLGAVVDELGLKTDPDSLKKSVTVEIPSGTTLINITAQAATPEKAQQISQAIAQNLSAVAESLEGALGVADPGVVLSVADPAALPEAPDPRGTATKAALGFILGALIGAAALWFLEFADSSVRRSDDLAAVTGRSVLGVVKRGTGVGVAPGSAAAEQFRSIRTALRATVAGTDRPVVVVAGVGTTSSAPQVTVNLAESLAKEGQRVLIIDADLRTGALSGLLGLAGEQGLAEALTSGGEMPAAREWRGCSVLPAGRAVDDAPERLGSAAVEALLSRVTSDYDAVLISAPGVLGVADAAILGAKADGMLLVADCATTTLADARHAQDRAASGAGSVLGWVLAKLPAYRLRTDAGFVPAPD